MTVLPRIWNRLLERASAGLRVKTLPMRNKRPIVSFTFDDFPQSAARCAGPILERHGMRGTFYAAGGLCGQTIDGIAYYDSADLAALSAAGHEIACHTFAHVRVSSLGAAALAEDIERNAACLRGQGVPVLENFSYPFGAVSPAAKLALQRRFHSCRGIKPGINAGTADLGLLRATSLYGNAVDPRIVDLIGRAVASNGWLIVYTHDVSERPSPYGCTPEVFAELVDRVAGMTADAAAGAGLAVLTVRAALAAIRGR